jgi:predicted ribosome quality control (RQC) complex YloA/Tae2 family protein
MQEIILDLNKSVEKNAEVYYDSAKKARRKYQGAEKTLIEFRQKLEKLNTEKEKAAEKLEKKKKDEKPKAEKLWYEKFRWFITSSGLLAIGGRDATSNDIIIKKHAEKDDLVFHTDLAGSPFFVVKAEGKAIDEQSISEAAVATACFSRAWKANLSTTEVFYVKPEQVTKEAKAGEYLGKGAFVIKGKVTYMHPNLKLALGITEGGKIMSGPETAVKKNCRDYVIIMQGSEKASDAAKKIRKQIGGELDEIIRALPSGGVKIGKRV